MTQSTLIFAISIASLFLTASVEAEHHTFEFVVEDWVVDFRAQRLVYE